MSPPMPDPQRSRAVLVGTATYADPALHDLPAVAHNIADLTAFLTDEQGTGLPAAHCVPVLDPHGAAQVGDVLAAASDAAEDMLLVYYAGHGLARGSRNDLYLAMPDTRFHGVATSALPCAAVKEIIAGSTAATRVLILDCCASGRAIEQNMSAVTEALLHQVAVQGAFILTATEGPSLALAPTGQQHTLFTGELLAVLRDGVPHQSEFLTMDLLFKDLRRRLGRLNRPLPMCNSTAGAAHLALARNAAYPPQLRALSATLDAIGALESAEQDAATAHADMLDRFTDPAVTPHEPVAAGLRERAAALDRFAATKNWAELTAELTTMDSEIARARDGAARVCAALPDLLAQRTDLRGLLRSYHVMAVRIRIAERPDVAGQYELARTLLWTRPCDLRAATAAVTAFQDLVVASLREGAS